MKSAISFAGFVALSQGYIAKTPLMNFGIQNQKVVLKQSLGPVEGTQDIPQIPYSFTETFALYTFNETTGSLDPYQDMVITSENDAGRNKQHDYITLVDENQHPQKLHEFIDFTEEVAYVYYPEYDFCETYPFHVAINLTELFDSINNGSFLTDEGVKSAPWDSQLYHVVLLNDT